MGHSALLSRSVYLVWWTLCRANDAWNLRGLDYRRILDCQLNVLHEERADAAGRLLV